MQQRFAIGYAKLGGMAEREPILNLRRAAPGYAEDYAAWLDTQVRSLRAGAFKSLDLSNLIDEVESLGRSDFKGFVSAIEIVLVHMLKWDFQPERRLLSWIASIAEHRERISDELLDSPSYKARIQEAVDRAFRTARPAAAKEAAMPLAAFPDACPYDWTAITTRDHKLIN